MYTLRLFVRTAIVTGVVAGGMQSHAAAQLDTTLPAKAATYAPQAGKSQNATATHQLRVRNVRPGIIAWWLDPAHQTEPIEFTQSRWNFGFSHDGKPKAPEAANVFKLPAGVTSIQPVDAQNMLLVQGTPEGFRQLEQTVKQLDRPIRQVEISMQILQISPEDAKSLNVEFPPADANTARLAIGRVRGDIQPKIDELLQQKKAKLVNAPRVSTMNNFAANLGHATTGTPAILGVKDEAGQFKTLYEPPMLNPKDAASIPRVLMTSLMQFVVTPTINNDKTITLLLEPSKTLWVMDFSYEDVLQDPFRFGEKALFLKTLDKGTAIVNLANKETIALTGSMANLFSSDGFSADGVGQKNSNVLILLNVGIHRRTEDLAPIPPPL